MKLLTIFAAITLLSAMQAQASLSYLTCSNGTIDTVGDALMIVNILEDGYEFQPYESFFSVDATQVSFNGGTHVIADQTVTISSEGIDSSATVDAIALLNDDNTKLNISYSIDKGEFQSYVLDCKTVVVKI